MCGIVGFIGKSDGVNFIVEGLRRLKYRGYDSAGIAYFQNNEVEIVKKCGKLEELEKELKKTDRVSASVAIGHTRWATHGEPTQVNAHPIRVKNVVVVHNGIVENYLSIKQFLKKKGYEFKTKTDTEVAAALIDFFYTGSNCFEAIVKASEEFKGSFALAVMFANKTDSIFAVRKGSALLVGFGKNENYLASDIAAFVNKTKKYAILNENEVAVLTCNEISFFDFNGKQVQKTASLIDWNFMDSDKQKFDSFMMKEIFEQPEVVSRCFKSRIESSGVSFDIDGVAGNWLKKFNRIHIVACGTAMHAGLFGKSLLESLARIPTQVFIASEFRYCNPILFEKDLVIVVSQSGETADSLAALLLAKQSGVATLAIVNVKSSTMAQVADRVIFTDAGPEISVASTKAFSVQLSVFYLLAIKFAQLLKTKTEGEVLKFCDILQRAPNYMEHILSCKNQILDFAKAFFKKQNMFYIGRGVDYYLSLEGSLKLKELSYIHSEAYAAGELKHGTISLIEKGFPVVALVTQSSLTYKTLSNVKEVKARGAEVLLICNQHTRFENGLANLVFRLPEMDDLIAPLSAAVVLQLFACNVADLKGLDVDMPRNLAKSVTVE